MMELLLNDGKKLLLQYLVLWQLQGLKRLTIVMHLFSLIPFFFPQLLEYDKELSVFKDRLHELEISFPPR